MILGSNDRRKGGWQMRQALGEMIDEGWERRNRNKAIKMK